jgi:2,4-dienoyl-CoA reductase (NADPH2)
MAASRYPKLLAPLEVHGRTLINRVIMGSMHTGLEEGEHHFDSSLRSMAAFYEERARGGVGLIVTGGIAPNNAGRVAPFAAMMTSPSDAVRHKEVVAAVHQHHDAAGNGPRIAMQILHAGRYGYHPWAVGPTNVKAPIGWFTPTALSEREIEATIGDFVRSAQLAEEAGYDGVEVMVISVRVRVTNPNPDPDPNPNPNPNPNQVMGSEGYLLNQFLAKQVNTRTDAWGGSFEKRTRLALRIVEGIRAATAPDFIVIFRLSMLDLVKAGPPRA